MMAGMPISAPILPPLQDAAMLAMMLAFANNADQLTVWGVLIGAVLLLGPVISSWIRVYDWCRGARVDTSAFVTRAELAAHKLERDAQIKEIVTNIQREVDEIKETTTAIGERLGTFSADFQAIQRALGRLEGKLAIH